MAEPVLEADRVGVTRGDTVIIQDLSLRIDTETRLLVQGPSGAGKTTFFDVLGLLEPPSQGTLRVDGTDVSTVSERERARIRRETIGFVFQEFHLIPDLTARENVIVPQDHAGNRDEPWVDTLFERLDIAHCEDRYPGALSGGEKQRVGIARALANRPDVVMADEPTGQLDPDSSDRVLDLLFDLQEQADTGLVVVSHDREVANRFDTVYRLENGTLDVP